MTSSNALSGRSSNLSDRQSDDRRSQGSSSGDLHGRPFECPVQELSGIMHSLRASTQHFLQLLMDPVDRLETVFQDLIDYKVGAVCAGTSAWKLAQWLDGNPPLADQIQAVTSIRNLAQTQACRFGLLTCPKLIRKLIEILRTSTSVELQSVTAECLRLLVKTKAGARCLLLEFGIPTLVQMLSHSSEPAHTTAVYILNQLMWHVPQDARPEFRACNGQNAMAEWLSAERLADANSIIFCVDTIRMAVYRCSEAKLALLETNVHADLVRLLRIYGSQPKVAYNIVRLVKVLSTCSVNKTRLVDSGAVEALTLLLQNDEEFLQLECLWSLRNLSDRACHLTSTRTLIMRLSDLLASRDENISICSIGCLCNFTCKNSYNKGLLVETGGVARLCQLLNLNPQRQEITEPICSALRHATHRSPHTDAAIFEIRSSGALPTVVSLLQREDCTAALPLIKAVVGLIRNLAYDDETRAVLKSHGVVRLLARTLKQTRNTIQEYRKSDEPSLLLDISAAGDVAGVRLDDMLELCLIALHSMARDRDVQEELIHTAGIVACVVQLLHTSSESIQRAAVALLNQLASEKSGAGKIEQEGACARLTELIQSNNEHIAAYSAAVIHRITLDKPIEYRIRVSSELRQALFDGGIMPKEHPIAEELLKYLERNAVLSSANPQVPKGSAKRKQLVATREPQALESQ